MNARFAAAALSLFLAAAPLRATDPPARPEAADKPIPEPTVSVTHHKGVFGGQPVAYTATASETYLKAEDGTPKASLFSVSYVKEGPRDPARPVTFLFNGGPGSGSLWLHMGAFGPKRVVIPGTDARDDGAPPYPIIDNFNSLLDVTDLVFIDPVGTGFSHALGKTEPKEYWGVTQDAKSIGQFIRLWLDRNGRWNAPKFLGGESYGTTRSAAVAHELMGSYNDVALNGIILISTILDFGLASEAPGNEMAYVVNLPSMATAAFYHRKVANPPTGVEQFAEEARRFATGPYLAALVKGNRLGADERAEVRRQLSRYTGLSETYLDQADLRVVPFRFFKELLRDRGQTIGRLDTRYLGRDYDNAGENFDNDPSFYAIDGAYTAALNAYARGDLGFQTDRQYVTIGGVKDWDWKVQGVRDNEGYMTVAPFIGESLRENSGLRIFVAQGWYDFATPFFAAEYSLNRTGIPGDRIQFHYYDAGHMMYVRDQDLAKLSGDVRAFIRARGQ
ncbi:MAG TPA: peptidase S10 [Allosphingosinicella sp.]